MIIGMSVADSTGTIFVKMKVCVIVASVCSGHGFKFAPVMGEIIAGLVQGKKPAFDLSMFHFRSGMTQ